MCSIDRSISQGHSTAIFYANDDAALVIHKITDNIVPYVALFHNYNYRQYALTQSVPRDLDPQR